jgi:hypothetical protein
VAGLAPSQLAWAFACPSPQLQAGLAITVKTIPGNYLPFNGLLHISSGSKDNRVAALALMDQVAHGAEHGKSGGLLSGKGRTREPYSRWQGCR